LTSKAPSQTEGDIERLHRALVSAGCGSNARLGSGLLPSPADGGEGGLPGFVSEWWR